MRYARYSFAFVGALVGLVILLVDASVAADYFRYFVLVMGAVLVVFSLRIVWINYKISRRVTGGGFHALLPLHIMSIATSYMIFVISTHIWVVDRLGNDALWYGLPLIVIADVIGIFALGVIWRAQIAKKEAMDAGG